MTSMANPYLLHNKLPGVQGRGPGYPGTDGHHGLSFDKFFGYWAIDPNNHPWEIAKGESGDAVLRWLGGSAAPGKGLAVFREIGDAARLGQAAARLESLARGCGGWSGIFKLESRLITGIGAPHPSENGFLFHPTLGVPYLPGTGLKQVAAEAFALLPKAIGVALKSKCGVSADMAALCRDITGDDGGANPERAGTIMFLDGLPATRMKLVAETITPHYGLYYQNFEPAKGRAGKLDDFHEPADWHDPVPVTLLAVEKAETVKEEEFGRLRIALLPGRRATPVHLCAARIALTLGLEHLGFGAKTTLGYGRLVE
jgi:CRISPR-associated protein Cmr6